MRAGQTEAAVDLARLAGLVPAGVICEVMNDDGTMARVPDLLGFCATHHLKLLTVASLIRYRLEHETFVRRVAEGVVETEAGDFRTRCLPFGTLTTRSISPFLWGTFGASTGPWFACTRMIYSEMSLRPVLIPATGKCMTRCG